MRSHQPPGSHDFPVEDTPEHYPDQPWWEHPPLQIDEMLHILATRAPHLNDPTPEGVALRALLAQVDQSYRETEEEIKKQYPIAYFKPSL